MSKSKSGFSIFSEIYFMSSLPMEEAVRLVGAMASPEIAVTLTEVNGEFWRYEVVQKFRVKRGEIGVKGVLRRWQGTLTRVDCRTYIQRPLQKWIHRLMKWSLPLVLFLVGLSAFYTVLPRLIYQSLLFTGLAVLFSIWTGLFIYFSSNLSEQHEIEYLSDADRLLNGFIRAFKSVGSVSLDGSNLEDAGVDAVLETSERRILHKRKQPGEKSHVET
jgi:hypothetical protein